MNKDTTTVADNETSFSDKELDWKNYSQSDQQKMADFLEEFMSDESNFEDEIPEDEE